MDGRPFLQQQSEEEGASLAAAAADGKHASDGGRRPVATGARPRCSGLGAQREADSRQQIIRVKLLRRYTAVTELNIFANDVKFEQSCFGDPATARDTAILEN
jgi:hypothetical protein